jgi:tRNA uridine 5-carboxymethylaminomethyl modification enzyme
MQQLLETTKLTGHMLREIEQALKTEKQALALPLAQRQDDHQANEESDRTDLSAALGQSCAQLLKRPEILIEHLVPVLVEVGPRYFDRNSNPVSTANLPSAIRNELKSVETEVKYAGYLEQQERAIARLKKAEQRTIPEWFDYHSVSGLSREIEEKLVKIRPRTLGHAARIPGVTPAAVSLVNVFIEIQARRRDQAAAAR